MRLTHTLSLSSSVLGYAHLVVCREYRYLSSKILSRLYDSCRKILLSNVWAETRRSKRSLSFGGARRRRVGSSGDCRDRGEGTRCVSPGVWYPCDPRL